MTEYTGEWTRSISWWINHQSVHEWISQLVHPRVSQSVSQSISPYGTFTIRMTEFTPSKHASRRMRGSEPCIMYGYDILDDIKKKKEKSKLVSSAKYTPFEWKTPKPALHCFCVGLLIQSAMSSRERKNPSAEYMRAFYSSVYSDLECTAVNRVTFSGWMRTVQETLVSISLRGDCQRNGPVRV